MAEKKIVNITPNEEESKDELEQEQVNPDPPKEEPKDETKEEKKEFFLIRGAKAVGRGVAKTGKAINGFVHEHPVASSIISGGLGFAAKYGWDYLMASRGEESEACSSVAEDVDVPMLTMDEPEDEMMEFSTSTQEETPVENVVEE